MRTWATILLFLSCVVASLAQGSSDTIALSDSKKAVVSLYKKTFELQSPLVSGRAYAEYQSQEDEHPYLGNDDWFNGTVSYNGTHYENVPLQFDIQRQKLLLEHPVSARKVELVAEKVSQFTLDQRIFISGRGITIGGSDRFAFYEVLANGGATLLCGRSKSLQQKNRAGRIHRVFQEINKYYVVSDQQVQPVSSRRSMLAVLSAINPSKAEIVRKKKLKFNGSKERMLIDTIKAFNETL